jgi:hypothetical protein
MRCSARRVNAISALALAGVVVTSLGAMQPAAWAHPGAAPASDTAAAASSITTFVGAPPASASGPDDLTILATNGLDGGHSVVWVGFQNKINPDGTPATAGGATQSTLAGFDSTSGVLVKSIAVTGKIDGLAADSKNGRLLATVNEDSNSAFEVVDPTSGSVTTFRYSPDPAVGGNGGTDSIALKHGRIYVAHSNPSDTTQASIYQVSLDASTAVATLRPVFFDDSTATDAVTRHKAPMGLTDPDTNYVMPSASPRFAHQLATISQADGKIVFASHLGHDARLTVLSLTDNVNGNVPPIDGLAVATADHGRLLVVDSKAGTVSALDTSGFPAGTVFVTEPSDNANPLLGTLDLSTGHITPLVTSFGNPKAILFVPSS